MATWRRITDEDWKNATSATMLDGKIYVVADSALYRVGFDGAYQMVSSATWQSRLLAGTGDKLYSVERSGIIYRVDPSHGGWERVTDGWNQATAAAGTRDALVLADEGGELSRLHLRHGTHERFGGGGWSTNLLAVAGGTLFALLRDGSLYAIEPATGLSRRCDGDWQNASAMGGDERGLYVAINDGGIYGVDPATGEWWEVDTGASWQSRHLFVVDRAVYTIEQDGAFYEVLLDGTLAAD
jgi:outer membrane protein assembly factor BamB